MPQKRITGVSPPELAGVGFVFGIAAGVILGLLDREAYWPIIGAGTVGIILVPVIARWRASDWIRREKQRLVPRLARKA